MGRENSAFIHLCHSLMLNQAIPRSLRTCFVFTVLDGEMWIGKAQSFSPVVPPIKAMCPKAWTEMHHLGLGTPTHLPTFLLSAFPDGVAQSAFLQADLAGASCTLRGLPWSCQTMTQKVRPVMSMRHSHPSQSRVTRKQRRRYSGSRRNSPEASLPEASYRFRNQKATGFLGKD